VIRFFDFAPAHRGVIQELIFVEVFPREAADRRVHSVLLLEHDHRCASAEKTFKQTLTVRHRH